MIEHYTVGIVLARLQNGEQNATVVIYTKDLGKISAFTKSIRKPTSKLSGHLVPGNIIKARIIEKNKLQAVDVLSEKPPCDSSELLRFVSFLNQSIPYDEPDPLLWKLIEEIVTGCRFTPDIYEYILDVLGFGGEFAVCAVCKSHEIAHFSLPDIMFLCSRCGARRNLKQDELIKIKKG